jgi:hypothetical protein
MIIDVAIGVTVATLAALEVWLIRERPAQPPVTAGN